MSQLITCRPVSAALRVQYELNEYERETDYSQCPISVKLKSDDLLDLEGIIAGPPGTPYEGGKFKLEVKVSPNYPFCPPHIRFVSPIWHPNVFSLTGSICLDVLGGKWRPSMTLRTSLLSIQALLGSPEPNDPHDPQVAFQFKQKYNMFVKTAKHWTGVHAQGPHRCEEFDQQVDELCSDGMKHTDALNLLSITNWDLMKVRALRTEFHQELQRSMQGDS